MNRSTFLTALVVMIFISGCAGAPQRPQELNNLNQQELLKQYYWAHNLAGYYAGWAGTSKKEYLRKVVDRLYQSHPEWNTADKDMLIKDPRYMSFKLHPEWDKRICDAILNKQIFLGMTKEQLLLSWGKPDSINRTVLSQMISEQWIYSVYPKEKYVYLENDVITSWQD